MSAKVLFWADFRELYGVRFTYDRPERQRFYLPLSWHDSCFGMIVLPVAVSSFNNDP
jgi:hypothetical protein